MRNLIMVMLIAGAIAGTAASITPEDLFGDVNYSYLDMTVPGFSSNTTFSMMDLFDNTSMSFFSQFYFSSSSVTSSVSMTSGLSQPRRIEIRGHEPQLVYLFGAEPIPYREFVSRASLLGTNQLWISGTGTWTQYVVCPVNTLLKLIADSTEGGVADIYEIYPNNTINRRQYPIFAGANEMNFKADAIGRNIVFFIANSIPSNIVIIDVVPAIQTAPQQTPQQATPTVSGVSAVQVYTPPTMPAASSQAGDTVVIVKSTGMRGYDVYLDDVYVGTDGRGGDPLDGVFTLRVVGNMEHFIKVWDGQFFYGKPKYYPRGVTTTLWVEPGYALYI